MACVPHRGDLAAAFVQQRRTVFGDQAASLVHVEAPVAGELLAVGGAHPEEAVALDAQVERRAGRPQHALAEVAPDAAVDHELHRPRRAEGVGRRHRLGLDHQVFDLE